MQSCPSHSRFGYQTAILDPHTKEARADTVAPVNTQHLKLQPHEVTHVVAHGPCPDGTAAAYIALAYKASIVVTLTTHGDMEGLGRDLAGKHVLFVDIAPRASTLEAWEWAGHKMASFAILDHHITAMEDLKKLPDDLKVFDMKHSGCALAWDYFFPQYALPNTLRAVEARDLYDWDRVVNSREICTQVPTCPCIGCWRMYINGDIAKHIADGALALRFRDENVKDIASGAQRGLFEGVPAWYVRVDTPDLISDVGHAILSGSSHGADPRTDIAVVYRINERNEALLSLRSENEGPTVSHLAAMNGGGGHTHAAGCTLKGYDNHPAWAYIRAINERKRRADEDNAIPHVQEYREMRARLEIQRYPDVMQRVGIHLRAALRDAAEKRDNTIVLKLQPDEYEFSTRLCADIKAKGYHACREEVVGFLTIEVDDPRPRDPRVPPRTEEEQGLAAGETHAS